MKVDSLLINNYLLLKVFGDKIYLINDQYVMVKELGKDGTSNVHLVYDKKNKNEYIVFVFF